MRLKCRKVDGATAIVSIEEAAFLQDLLAALPSCFHSPGCRIVHRGGILSQSSRLVDQGVRDEHIVFVVPAASAAESTSSDTPSSDFEVAVRSFDGQQQGTLILTNDCTEAEVMAKLSEILGFQHFKIVCRGSLLSSVSGAILVKQPQPVDLILVPVREIYRQRCLRRLRQRIGSASSWLSRVWRDPWMLVRPETHALGRRTRVIFNPLDARHFRYAPGRNPNGEDFTWLFTQGMLGYG
mmetsp:Transcript_29329/g.62555  ORF Transcript_29329/g.62555 Transcript_29329/m.62555 type:complete len:239 (+) Transcript_29329:39-755(+)